MVYPWVDTCCLLGFKTMQRNCRGTSKCLQSCWGLEKLVLVWKCHAVAWHHGLYEIWRQACQWFGFAFRLCSWSCMLAPRKRRICMQLASRTSWSSVLYLSFLFAMLCSSSFCIFICTSPKQTLLMSARSSFHWGMSTFDTFDVLCFHMRKPCHDYTSICCVFICTNPNQTSILGSGGNLQLWHAKKKLIELSFRNSVAPAGMVRPHRFEVWTTFAWGLYILQKVPQPSKPTWASVQDVVLNSLRPSTQPSQPLPELSHFYQTHKQQGEMSCSCRYGSCWCVTPWHKMMRSC